MRTPGIVRETLLTGLPLELRNLPSTKEDRYFE